MKKLVNIIVVCNTRLEFLDCVEKSKNTNSIEFHSCDWNMQKEKELNQYNFPIYLIIETFLGSVKMDWCIDKDCHECGSKIDCDGYKKISAKDYLENFRGSKITRILNV